MINKPFKLSSLLVLFVLAIPAVLFLVIYTLAILALTLTSLMDYFFHAPAFKGNDKSVPENKPGWHTRILQEHGKIGYNINFKRRLI